MQSALPLACFLSMIRPPGIQFENSLLQITPVDKGKCPYMRDHNDIEFRLYTRHNPTVYQELIINDDEKLFASNIDYHAPTVLFFHAFMETADEGSAASVRESYINRGDSNVIMVDASQLEAGPWYFTAAENTWYIGKFAARFVDYLVSRGLDLKTTHFVGHSLGAQAAGVAGSALKSGRVSRITGLDPALPLFHGLPEEQRLDRSDADFVDVIHTDGGIFGVNKPVGHADFYPNGGISPQPGCELEVVIPQHMLLNKCQNYTQGYYTFYIFHLKPYKSKTTKKLEKGLHKLFTKIYLSKPNKKTEYEPTKVNKKGDLFTPDTKDVKQIQRDETKVDDQEMIESVRRYYETMPYFIAINDKDYSKTDTFKTINKGLDNHGIHTELDTETNQGSIFKVITDEHLQLKTLEQDTLNNDYKPVKENKETSSTEEHVSNRNQETQTQEDLKPENLTQDALNTDHQHAKPANNYVYNQETSTMQTHPKDNINIEHQIVKQTDVYNKETSTIQKSASNQNQETFQSQTQDHFQTKEPQEPFKTDHQNAEETHNHETSTTQESQQQNHATKRQKRFINPFQKSEGEQQENFLFRILNFLFKNGRNIPVYSVMREINTLVKSGHGELNHVSKERNNFIGAPPPIIPVTYSLELGNESKTVSFMKKLLGLTPKGDRLTISGTGK